MFERMASAKLAWLGIPEFRIPAPFTSLVDFVASSVTATKRDGEVFVVASGKRWHAVEHAALSIAVWLILRLREVVDAVKGAADKSDVDGIEPVPL